MTKWEDKTPNAPFSVMTKWEDKTPIERLQVAASGSYYHEEIQWGIDRIAELERQLAAVRGVIADLDTQTTNGHAVRALRKALAEKGNG